MQARLVAEGELDPRLVYSAADLVPASVLRVRLRICRRRRNAYNAFNKEWEFLPVDDGPDVLAVSKLARRADRQSCEDGQVSHETNTTFDLPSTDVGPVVSFSAV
jgi:hypothetical protein